MPARVALFIDANTTVGKTFRAEVMSADAFSHGGQLPELKANWALDAPSALLLPLRLVFAKQREQALRLK